MNEERNELNSPSGSVVLTCPFCGDPPDIETLGSCVDFECCVSMSRQKCDYLTIEERETYDSETYRYRDEIETWVYQQILNEWNTRAPQNGEREHG